MVARVKKVQQQPARRTAEAPALKTVTLLGATGSIGSSTIDLLQREPDRYCVEAVTANRNAGALARLARELGARFAAVGDPQAYSELKSALSGSGIAAAAGPEALVEAAQRPAEWVMAAITGAASLKPTLAAAERGAAVAIANKECLVCAGGLFMRPARRCCRSIRSIMRFSRLSEPAAGRMCAASSSPPRADRFAPGRSMRSAK